MKTAGEVNLMFALQLKAIVLQWREPARWSLYWVPVLGEDADASQTRRSECHA